MPITLLLLLTAFGIMAALLFVMLGRYADRGAKLLDADETITELQATLEKALDEQAHLTRRVENLEAIVTSEAWDALQENPRLDVPPEPSPELSDEEKAARLARRQRTR
jgi:hypothetical protein